MPLSDAVWILATATGSGAAGMWLLFHVLSPRRPHAADAAVPDPAELLRLRAALEAPEWLVCASTTCARMTTLHRRTAAEFATCTFCGTPAFVPAPTAAKEAPGA